MSKTTSLKAEKRARTGSGLLNQMRSEGWVPAIIYGRSVEPTNLKVDAKTFSDLLAHSAADNIIVTLDIEGEQRMALIQDVQHDHISRAAIHIDFLAVDENTEIRATIPVILSGEPAGVKQGGLLEQLIYDIEVVCLPKDLPEVIDTDVSELVVGDSLDIADLNFPEGVEARLPGDIRVASVIKTRVSATSDLDDPAAAGEADAAGEEEAPAEEAGAAAE